MEGQVWRRCRRILCFPNSKKQKAPVTTEASSVTGPLTIALDVMGGDHAPVSVLRGAEAVLKRRSDVHFLLFGDEAVMAPELRHCKRLIKSSEIRHTAERVLNEDKPSVALRARRGSSMRLAINAVADGEAHCVVSAGNTGALMAMAKFVLKTLAGIERPALASMMPTTDGSGVVMLDLGANVECDAENLVQFALMGTVYARILLGKPRPRVALLNIGAEELKGHESVREAATRLREVEFHGTFDGFIEGDRILAGDADVVVTDGFTGNVALKTIEGTARSLVRIGMAAVKRSLLAKIGVLFALPALLGLRKQLDPKRYNGAMMLGLRSPCVKSHGSADAVSFAHAIDAAIKLVEQNVTARIAEEIQRGLAAEPAQVTAAGL
jgi:phosphate acyltransferase